MFVDTADTIEFGEFQEYMHNMIIGKDIPNEWARINKEEQEEESSNNNNSNSNDGYRKFINDVNKSTAVIEFPSKEEVEKRFGPIPPDEDEEEDSNKKEDL